MTVTHLLDVASLSPESLETILSLAVDPQTLVKRPLGGRGVALIFEKPSNRTRHSMEIAVMELGGHPVYTRGEEIGLDVREPVEDVTRILAGYHSVLAARVFDHSTLERMASVSAVPVINLLSDRSHPLQAIADVLTMNEVLGTVRDARIAWIGDYNNVARSLAEAVCLLGGQISLGCPLGHGAGPEERGRLESLGGGITETEDPFDAVRGASIVHTDTWVSMGQEDEAERRRASFAGYQVTGTMMEAAQPGAWFMHCMPAHRGEEVTAEVFDGPRSLVIRQGHNRLSAARGALAHVLGTVVGGQR